MQTVRTKYTDDVRSAHPVTWCDAAEPHAYMSSTVITVGSEKEQKRDISGDLSPDIPSDIVGILETDGILPEKVDEEENEGISRQDPAANSPGAATRSTSIPPPPWGGVFVLQPGQDDLEWHSKPYRRHGHGRAEFLLPGEGQHSFRHQAGQFRVIRHFSVGTAKRRQRQK